jgi:hypothetical protein
MKNIKINISVKPDCDVYEAIDDAVQFVNRLYESIELDIGDDDFNVKIYPQSDVRDIIEKYELLKEKYRR